MSPIIFVIGFLLARVGKDYNGPVVVLVSKRLNQVHQIGVLHFFWGEDVPLVQFLHCPSSMDGKKFYIKDLSSKYFFFYYQKPYIYNKTSSTSKLGLK